MAIVEQIAPGMTAGLAKEMIDAVDAARMPWRDVAETAEAEAQTSAATMMKAQARGEAQVGAEAGVDAGAEVPIQTADRAEAIMSPQRRRAKEKKARLRRTRHLIGFVIAATEILQGGVNVSNVMHLVAIAAAPVEKEIGVEKQLAEKEALVRRGGV